MHPLLATRGRILLYLAGWIPILALLDYLVWASGGAGWERNTAVLGPACVLFAFACLSPWPMCRVRPLRLADAAMLALTWAAAAAAAAAAQVTASMGAPARLSGRTRHIGQGERQANANRKQAGPSTAVLCNQLAPPDAHIR